MCETGLGVPSETRQITEPMFPSARWFFAFLVMVALVGAAGLALAATGNVTETTGARIFVGALVVIGGLALAGITGRSLYSSPDDPTR